MMRRLGTLLLVMLCMQAAYSQSVRDAGCTLQNTDHYTCSVEGFTRLLAQAKAVRLDTGRMDAYGRSQMRRLAAELGKQVVEPEQRPDLVLELVWIDRSGRIDFGPAQVAVARLNVYDPSRGAGERGLVWVETLDGREDDPWPSMVSRLIQNFRTHIATNAR